MKKKILALLAFTGVSLGVTMYLKSLKNGKEKDIANDEKEEIKDEEVVDPAD